MVVTDLFISRPICAIACLYVTTSTESDAVSGLGAEMCHG